MTNNTDTTQERYGYNKLNEIRKLNVCNNNNKTL